MSKSKSFAQGALVLVVASAVTKVIGAIFKIPLANLIGADGLGVFSIAYTIYTTLFIISTAGLPVAISKLVAEANAKGKYDEVRHIGKVAITSFCLIGVLASVLLVVFARDFTVLVGNKMAYYAVITVAPSLFFVSLMSTIRGYFQGLSDMVPTAISQIVESVGKLVVGIAFALFLIKMGYPTHIAAAGAIFGVTCGTMLSALYLVVCKLKIRTLPKQIVPSQKQSFGTVFKKLIKLSIPVTIGASVLSVTNLVDMFLVMRRLQVSAGFTEAAANKLYGAYSMAVSIFNLPQTLVVAIAISVIPAVVSFLAMNNRKKALQTTESAFRISAILALPAGVGILVLSKPIIELIYFNKPQDAQIAIPLLTILGAAVVFVAFVSLTNSILQAIGKVGVPVVTMLIGGLIKIAVNYILVGIPSINILGAPIGTICCYATIAILNLIVIKTQLKELSYFKIFLKPFIAAAVMGVFAYLINIPITMMVGSKIGVLLTIGLSAVIFVFSLLAIGGIPKNDVLLLPKGEKIAKILQINK